MKKLFNWLRKRYHPGFRLYFFDTVTSTNDVLIEMMKEGEPEGAVVVAEEQTAGRGRFDRKWVSPRGGGLYFSLLLKMPPTREMVTLMPMVAAVAVVQVLRRDYRLSANIKWPNDILLSGRKLAGILCESKYRAAEWFIIVGIGVNLKMVGDAYPADVKSRMTTLHSVYEQPVDKVGLLEAILKELAKLSRLALRRPQKIISLWNRYCMHIDRRVLLKQGQIVQSGCFRGINESGAAIVELPTSEVVSFTSGEFSLEEESSCY